MKRIIFGVVTVFCLAGSLPACEEIFGDELTGSPVVLKAPLDSVVVADTTVLLTWNHTAVSADYQVQVVQPAFDTLSQVLKDTITKNDSLRLVALVKGKRYQWRVRAISRNYVTTYSGARTFMIKK